MITIKSPIKWTGGKAREIRHFEDYIPKYNIYVEPFVGGGALFWHLQPCKAVINDINGHLINFYLKLRDNYKILNELNQVHEHNIDYFKNIVKDINDNTYDCNVKKASDFYYINRTCFSGKWRVSASGNFNNSWGNYKNKTYKVLDREYSNILINTRILNVDYTSVLSEFKDNSDAFIFLDPPYLECDGMYTANQEFLEIYNYIAQYMMDSKSKVMMVVKSSSYIEEKFKNLIVDRYSKVYSHNATSDKKHEHLVICNYRMA